MVRLDTSVFSRFKMIDFPSYSIFSGGMFSFSSGIIVKEQRRGISSVSVSAMFFICRRMVGRCTRTPQCGQNEQVISISFPHSWHTIFSSDIKVTSSSIFFCVCSLFAGLSVLSRGVPQQGQLVNSPTIG